MNLQGKNIVLTGAGSGIGQQLALVLLEKGAYGLRETKNKAAKNADKFEEIVLNVTNKDDVFEFIKALLNRSLSVDGLINNAGIIQPFEKVDNLSWEAIEKVMDVNFNGLLYLTKALLPELKSKKESLLVNVSSMGGFLPVPGQAVYGASKAAVKLLTEALYSELKDDGVSVSVVFPGAVETNIAKNSEIEINTEDAGDYKMTSARSAAEIIIKGIEKEKFRILVGSDAKMMDFMYRLMPRRATEMIAKRMGGLLK
jgi:short-subunit dehydrogenase